MMRIGSRKEEPPSRDMKLGAASGIVVDREDIPQRVSALKLLQTHRTSLQELITVKQDELRDTERRIALLEKFPGLDEHLEQIAAIIEYLRGAR